MKKLIAVFFALIPVASASLDSPSPIIWGQGCAYNLITQACIPTSSGGITALTSDVSASGSGSVPATVNSVGGSTAASVHSAQLAASAATSTPTANTIAKWDSSSNLSANALSLTTALTATSGGASPATKIFYVDNGRSDTYTPTGSLTKPYLTIQAAINALAAAGGNGIISVAGNVVTHYAENLTLNNSALLNIWIGSPNGAVIEPASGPAIDSSSNNAQLSHIIVSGLEIIGNVNLAGNTASTNFSSTQSGIVNCEITGDVTLTSLGEIEFVNDRITGNFSVYNVNGATIRDGTVSAGGSVSIQTDYAGIQPNGFSGSFVDIENGLVIGGNVTVDLDSEIEIRRGTRFGSPGGTITIQNGGFFQAFNSFIRSNITVNSGGIFESDGSFWSGTLSNSGTFTNNTKATAVGYTPATSGNWSTVPTLVSGALDTLASGAFVKALINGASSATNAPLVVKDGHFKSTQTTAPTATPNANAGTGATCSVANATDNAGTINLTTTAVLSGAGVECDVTFNKAYNVAPICVLSPTNSNAVLDSVIQGAYFTTATTKLSVNFANTDAVGRSYSWAYHCIETQ